MNQSDTPCDGISNKEKRHFLFRKITDRYRRLHSYSLGNFIYKRIKYHGVLLPLPSRVLRPDCLLASHRRHHRALPQTCIFKFTSPSPDSSDWDSSFCIRLNLYRSSAIFCQERCLCSLPGLEFPFICNKFWGSFSKIS